MRKTIFSTILIIVGASIMLSVPEPFDKFGILLEGLGIGLIWSHK